MCTLCFKKKQKSRISTIGWNFDEKRGDLVNNVNFDKKLNISIKSLKFRQKGGSLHLKVEMSTKCGYYRLNKLFTSMGCGLKHGGPSPCCFPIAF